MKTIQTYKLYNGIEMPCMGLGTASLSMSEMISSIETAYKNGCTLIDTGNAYPSEAYIGKAIKKLSQCGVLKREDLFLSTKIGDKLNKKSRPIGYYFYNSVSAPCHDTKRIVYEQVESSLKHLNTDYIDLMLIHWPYYEVLNEIWKNLEDLYDQKVLRAIGVSNCKKRHIERILRTANYVPMVNQINISPINICKEDYDYFKEKGIIIEGYSPLYTLNSPTRSSYEDKLRNLASSKGKSTSQIVLRWYLQKGIIPLPKSSNPTRVKANYDIFDFHLSEDEMKLIDSFNQDYNYLVESIFCPGY